MKLERQTITIDESKCTGCGTCARACAEGVIAIVDGVARVVNEDHCDGLGVCLGNCPQGAISFITVKRPATEATAGSTGAPAGGCPFWNFALDDPTDHDRESRKPVRATPNWPIKIRLTPPDASWLRGADLAIYADCAGFVRSGRAGSEGSGVAGDVRGKALLVGCPKFDDSRFYVERLADIFAVSDVRSVSVYHMSVACCSSMLVLVNEAQQKAHTSVPVTAYCVDTDGSVSDGRVI